MNDEVSVAELLVREGWGDRPVQSRWRVVAVMLAVVIGCGAAAVLVAFSSGQVHQDAAPVDQIKVVPMPQRTTGLGGAGQATDSPNDGGVGGGTGGDVVPGTHAGTVTEVPGTTSDTPSSTESSSTTTTTPTGGGPGVTVTSTTTTPAGVQSPPPPASSAPHQITCILIICW
ncbi:hypothetical protein [Amycolatopsis sp. NBC_00438]|uniref:hypothetical protein n=1 Tax=Amycolatopsis sp. NBC_00438 TaxID=2903558 RepID=UPI002E21F6BC